MNVPRAQQELPPLPQEAAAEAQPGQAAPLQPTAPTELAPAAAEPGDGEAADTMIEPPADEPEQPAMAEEGEAAEQAQADAEEDAAATEEAAKTGKKTDEPDEPAAQRDQPSGEGGTLPGVGAPPGPPPPAAMGPQPAGAGEPGPMDAVVADLAARLVGGLPERADGPWVIGVMDFPDLQGEVGDLGRYLAQRLTSALSRLEGVQTVARLRLSDVAAEMRIDAAGAADPTAGRRLGNAAGANALILGTVANLGETVELDAHVRDLDNRAALPSEFVRVARQPLLVALTANGASAGEQTADEAGKPRERVYVLDESQPRPGSQNESYRVTVEQAERRGNRVMLVVAFENRAAAPAQLLFRDNPYLIDAQGDRWNLTQPDPAGIWVFCCGAGIELIPGTRRRTRLVFGTSAAGGEATRFTLVGKEISPQQERTLVLSGVALREAAAN